MEKTHIMKFGLYGKNAYWLVKLAIDYCDDVKWINADYFDTAPDGELIYVDSRKFPVNFADEEARTQMKHDISSALLMIGRKQAGLKFSETWVNSWHMMRTSKNANNSFTIIWREWREHKIVTTLNEIAFLGELLSGRRRKDKLLAEYPKTTQEAIVGWPNDPFTISTIETLQAEVMECRQRKDAELKELFDAYAANEAACIDKWDRKIVQISDRLKKLKY